MGCASERCPGVVRKDCADWLAAVEARLPSISIHARDAAGRDLTEVRVSEGGRLLVERLDGRSIALDPGARTFRFSAPGAPDVTLELLLREGEKDRLVDVVLGAAAPSASAGPRGTGPLDNASGQGSFHVPVAAWALAGGSVLAFGAMTGFGLSAQAAVDAMRASCAPTCSHARVDGARRDMILANVALGAAVAALGAATLLTVFHNSPSPGQPPSVALRLSAGPSGVTFSGAF